MDSTLTSYRNLEILRILISAGADVFGQNIHSLSDDEDDYETDETEHFLFRMIRDQNIESLKLLIDMDRDILNFRSRSSKTLLILAAELSRVHVVKFLLELDKQNVMSGKPTMLNLQNRDGWTALSEVALNDIHEAHDVDSHETTRLLLEADRFYQSLTELLPDYRSIVFMKNRWRQTPLINAANENNFRSFELILAADPSALKVPDLYGDVPLMACVTFEDSKLLRPILRHTTPDMKWAVDEAVRISLDRNYFINAGNLLRDGYDLIVSEPFNQKLYERMFVEMFEDVEVLELLLKAGINPNLKNRLGYTAIFTASKNGNLKAVRILLEAGALPDLKCFGETSLMNAATPEVLKLLIGKSSLNAKNKDGMTALNIAVSQEDLEAVKLLVEAGASMNEKNNNRENPLFTAVNTEYENDMPEIVRYLIRKDKENIALGRRSMLDPEALHCAVYHEDLVLTRIFLEEIKDSSFLNSKNEDGRTALMEAIHNQSEGIVEIFIELADKEVLTATDSHGRSVLSYADQSKLKKSLHDRLASA